MGDIQCQVFLCDKGLLCAISSDKGKLATSSLCTSTVFSVKWTEYNISPQGMVPKDCHIMKWLLLVEIAHILEPYESI